METLEGVVSTHSSKLIPDNLSQLISTWVNLGGKLCYNWPHDYVPSKHTIPCTWLVPQTGHHPNQPEPNGTVNVKWPQVTPLHEQTWLIFSPIYSRLRYLTSFGQWDINQQRWVKQRLRKVVGKGACPLSGRFWGSYKPPSCETEANPTNAERHLTESLSVVPADTEPTTRHVSDEPPSPN